MCQTLRRLLHRFILLMSRKGWTRHYHFTKTSFVHLGVAVWVDFLLKSSKHNKFLPLVQLPNPRSENRRADQNVETLISVAFNYDCALIAIKFYEQKLVLFGLLPHVLPFRQLSRCAIFLNGFCGTVLILN